MKITDGLFACLRNLKNVYSQLWGSLDSVAFLQAQLDAHLQGEVGCKQNFILLSL